MLRDDQISLRKARGLKGQYQIKNLGKRRFFSDFEVFNPASNKSYRVSIRGFQPGETFCQCPDFQINTLGTCKHVEAILARLRDDAKGSPRLQRATPVNPEIYLRYDNFTRMAILLPTRPSRPMMAIKETFFDTMGNWRLGGDFQVLLKQIVKAPEKVKVYPDAQEYIDRELEQTAMRSRENELLRLFHNDQWNQNLLKTPLMDYQVEGAFFLSHRGRCILADEMGLGKTRQALAAAELMARERGVSRVLILTPATMLYSWLEEIRSQSLRHALLVTGKPAVRKAIYQQEAFFLVASYDTAKEDLELLNAWSPNLIILDEAQRIKNWESRTSQSIKRLNSRFAFALTGTPLENNLEELFSILQFIDPRRLGPAFQFLHDHRVLNDLGVTTGYKDLSVVKEKLSPVLLRRTRDRVKTQLPPISIETLRMEMNATQKENHDKLSAQLAFLLNKQNPGQTRKKGVMRVLTALRLVCAGISLTECDIEETPKFIEFSHRLGDLLGEGNHKVVVFSEWEKSLRQAETLLKKAGIHCAFLHGKLEAKKREKEIHSFREDKTCQVFLSTDTGSTGLNLQFADAVFNLEMPWNPAVYKQRVARVHRMGQARPVQVLNFVMKDSIEEAVLRSHESKALLFENLFSGINQDHAPKDNNLIEEIRSLLSCGEAKKPFDKTQILQPLIDLLDSHEIHSGDLKKVLNPADRVRLGEKLQAMAQQLLDVDGNAAKNERVIKKEEILPQGKN